MIVDDLKTIEKIGGSGTVVHVGKACELSSEQCLSNMVEFTKAVLDATPDNKSFFILETAAGQGTEACVTLFINKFDDLIGWNFVELIHLNDSKKDCGCKKDRHEDIGKGFITKDLDTTKTSGLKTFVIIAAQTNKAVILETPCGGKDSYEEIQKVIGWVDNYEQPLQAKKA